VKVKHLSQVFFIASILSSRRPSMKIRVGVNIFSSLPMPLRLSVFLSREKNAKLGLWPSTERWIVDNGEK